MMEPKTSCMGISSLSYFSAFKVVIFYRLCFYILRIQWRKYFGRTGEKIRKFLFSSLLFYSFIYWGRVGLSSKGSHRSYFAPPVWALLITVRSSGLVVNTFLLQTLLLSHCFSNFYIIVSVIEVKQITNAYWYLTFGHIFELIKPCLILYLM